MLDFPKKSLCEVSEGVGGQWTLRTEVFDDVEDPEKVMETGETKKIRAIFG